MEKNQHSCYIVLAVSHIMLKPVSSASSATISHHQSPIVSSINHYNHGYPLLSSIIGHQRALSIIIDARELLLNSISHYKSLLFIIMNHGDSSLSSTTHHSPSLTTLILCEPFSTSINHYPPLLTIINHYENII